MANNRIGFKCNICGEYIPLAKSMGGGFYLSPAFSEENLAQFLDDHAFCDKGGDETGSEGNFDLVYEFPEDK